MGILLKTCVLLIAVGRTIDVGAQHCLPSYVNGDKISCQDFEKMSAQVTDLVGRSVTVGENDVKLADSPFNVSTRTLIRAASGVIGRGANALKTVVVNGLVLLTGTVSSKCCGWVLSIYANFVIFSDCRNYERPPRDRRVRWHRRSTDRLDIEQSIRKCN